MKQFYIKYKNYLYLSIIFMIIFIMSYFCHYQADDYNYAHIPWTTTKLTGVISIIKSQVIMYKMWSGRVIFSGLGQLFMYTPKSVYALFNAIIFILLIYFIPNYFKKTKKNTLISFVMSFSLLWYFTPSFVEDFIWLSGSVNYLWPVFFTILFMSMIYKKYILEEKINKYLLFFLAFITGLSHEITIFVSGSFLLFIFLFNIRKFIKLFKKLDKELLITIVIYLASALFCILAPGNFQRATGGLSLDIITVLRNFWYIKYLIILLLISIIYQLIINRKKVVIYFKYILFPIGLSLVPMTFMSESFSERVMLIYVVLITIIIIDTLNDFSKENRWITKNKIEILIISVTLIIPLYITNYYAATLKNYNEDILFAVKESKLTGNSNLIINQIKIPNKVIRKYLIGFGHRPSVFKDSIFSHFFCNYYGCSSLVAKEEENILITIKSDSNIKLKYEESYAKREKEYMMYDETESKQRYVFQIPKQYKDKFEIIGDKNKIHSVEIRDLSYTELYENDEFEKIMEEK